MVVHVCLCGALLGTLYVMCLAQGQAVSEINCVLQQLNCSKLPYKTVALGIIKVILLTNIEPEAQKHK